MSDLHHVLTVFRETVAYVMGSAPDQFPIEDYLPADQQMTLERAYREMRAEFREFAESYGECPEVAQCRAAIDDSYKHFKSGETLAGKQRLNKMYHVLMKLGA